ncbi:cleavage and polyadenylation specificity factor subunit 6-like [Olea europaea var. sylvestris]|uniref:cleavage and polyadenylation specificity factor subunit 6-like n=1 Tax=Olea europaea var. sylvestris TaxID=158386 RepID=UPI000C1D2C3E|nr:cleavage and polyadenylation specificity factor subunit 6-like [Olea europaea var. sylvestris]XP_022859968.1 cleavage and polyadenylation specificity factor subunit 6-like [Olea europaea var. sylvestris]XP_022859969.1 cleavage and polyadenylation specificity factor subunit 6-like [Olea europaea var. sylvestris]
MDPARDEQLDYGDGEYGKKMQYHQVGTIPALAEEEMIGEDDEYDDLYNDVNVGEGFLQLHQSEAQTSALGVGNGGSQAPKSNVSNPRNEARVVQELNIPGAANEQNYASTRIQFPEQKCGFPADKGPEPTVDASQRGRISEMTHKYQAGHLEFQGSVPMPQKIAADTNNMSGKVAVEPSPSPTVGSSRVVPENLASRMNPSANVNVNRMVDNDTQIRPAVENGNTTLFVGELHWWTTDADLETVLSQYGMVKEIKFFDERASGKSKGYCQVEFYDPAAASACKDGVNGHLFNGRACVVAFANPQTIKQMGASYTNKTQAQAPSQPQGRRPMNDGAGRGNGTNYSSGDTGRNFGRGGWGRGGQQMPNRGPAAVPVRGRGAMATKNMIGNAPGSGGAAVGGAYGQGLVGGPAFGGHPGIMHPHGMMGPGFDPAFMGRGAGYGGFSGPAFPGMIPPFPAVNPMGLPGVAPHVNPAFFNRGMSSNGMSMMGTAGMDGPHSGMWNDPNMGGWGGEEQGRGTRESSYGGEDNASEYGHGEASLDKGVRSSAATREKERNSERDWSINSEKRHRDEREHDQDRYDREHKYREEKDGYRDYRNKERELGYEDDWDRGQSSRSRSRSRAVPEEDHRSRSRDADYGKRRHIPSK